MSIEMSTHDKPFGWWDNLSPISKKAYTTGHPNSSYVNDPRTSQSVKDAQNARVTNRKEYHEASMHFHKGKAAAIKQQVAKIPVNNKDWSDGRNHPFKDSLFHHEKAENLHKEALRLHNDMDHPELKEKIKPAYNKVLGDLKNHYENFERSELAKKNPIGAGHSRFISKE